MKTISIASTRTAVLAFAVMVFQIAGAARGDTLIDFSNLVSSTQIQQASLQSAGFNFYFAANTPDFTYDTFLVRAVGDPTNAAPAGKATILGDSETDPASMAPLGGGTFSVVSVDLASIYDGYAPYEPSGSETIYFTGDKAEGGAVTQSATIAVAQVGLSALSLSNFTDLTSLSWTGQSGGGPATQTDDFQLTDFDVVYTPSAMPEPAAWAIMLLGFSCLGAVLRSQRRTSSMFSAESQT